MWATLYNILLPATSTCPKLSVLWRNLTRAEPEPLETQLETLRALSASDPGTAARKWQTCLERLRSVYKRIRSRACFDIPFALVLLPPSMLERDSTTVPCISACRNRAKVTVPVFVWCDLHVRFEIGRLPVRVGLG